MGDRALLLGLEESRSAAFAGLLAQLGLGADCAGWRGFSPRAWRGRRLPALLVADADGPETPPMAEFCREVRRAWGETRPLFILTAARKLGILSALLDAGASDCLPRIGHLDLWERKISRRLAHGAALGSSELTEEIPGDLMGIFYRGGALVSLGELAGIYPGVSPRLPYYRRLAPPDSDWRAVLTADTLDRFLVGRPKSYLSWNRLHLFRMPGPEEYDVAEKVLIRRAGPPIAASLDRSRLPAGTDLYSLVPRDGVSAGYLACILNSRLLDFYFNRLAPRNADGRLRLDDMREVPVPRPTPSGLEELSRFANLLTHFGPRPQNWIDRQTKDETWERMEETVFVLYGAGNAVRDGLASLHF